MDNVKIQQIQFTVPGLISLRKKRSHKWTTIVVVLGVSKRINQAWQSAPIAALKRNLIMSRL